MLVCFVVHYIETFVMRPIDFVKTYLPYARKVENQTGLSAIASLAQCAVETGWGKTVVGNMMFGVKDSDGINGNEQLLTTTEYLKTPNAKFPVVISVKKYGNNLWKYVVKDYFRKYASPADSFFDHAALISSRPHFKKAWNNRNNYVLFLDEVAKAGYATGSEYAKVCIDVGKMIEKIILQNKL